MKKNFTHRDILVSSAAAAGASFLAAPAIAQSWRPTKPIRMIIGDAPAAEGGRAVRYEPTRNKAASPYRYEIDPDDLYRLTVATDDADETFWAIVHSHTHTPAVPSPTDIGLAFYPDALYVLVTLAADQADAATGEPGVRAWRIVDGLVRSTRFEIAFPWPMVFVMKAARLLPYRLFFWLSALTLRAR